MSNIEVDIFIWGDHPAAANAAVEAARLGLKALIVTNEWHIGAPYASGLIRVDVGALGGQNVAWTNREYFNLVSRNFVGNRFQMRVPTPSMSEQCYLDLIKFYGAWVMPGITITTVNKTLVSGSVYKISSILLSNGHTIVPRPIIHGGTGEMNCLDCSEDGDFGALAGANYFIGQEAAATYNETGGGWQPSGKTSPCDTSDGHGGYIYGVQPPIDLEVGAANPSGTQSFGWRSPVTDDPYNVRRWPKPAGYSEDYFQLEMRTIDWESTGSGLYRPLGLLGTGFYGKRDPNDDTGYRQTEWITANAAVRQEIAEGMYRARFGWLWFLANDSRVHDDIRRFMNTYKPCFDEFGDSSHTLTTSGLSYTFYRRGTRRLNNGGTGSYVAGSPYVMRQSDMQVDYSKTSSIATGYYNQDCHLVNLFAVPGGFSTNSFQNYVTQPGNADAKLVTPYDIPAEVHYTPELANLLVVNTCAKSFLADSSMRIDIHKANQGSACGAWAALALKASTAIQSYSISTLQAYIVAHGGVIHPSL